jgi:hypothetical protein
MGEIGPIRRIIEVLPLEGPAEPSSPVENPDEAPAVPTKEPVPQ